MGETLIMNKTIFKFLKDFGWTQVPRNRYVTLVFDMVSIKDVLPTMNETENMPTHVLLFTVKVISGKGFQPIGNVFLYENTPTWKLSDCIKAYICDLERCELYVVATVCPPTEYLRSAVENLVEMSTLKNKTDAHIYSVGSVNNIIHIYDAPSMLREVRNYFTKSPVAFKQFGEQCTANYKHVERTLKTTRNESLKTIVEMRKDNEEVNKFAIKLFSMSMSRELLQKATNKNKTPHRGTANLCSFFDVLFDSFNGTPDYDNLNRRPLNSFSPHAKIWRDAIPVLKSMKFSAELIQEDEREKNASLQQEKIFPVVLLQSDAKHKQKKTKLSSDQKIQGELNLNENQEKQTKKEGPDVGDGNEMISSHVKRKKEKKGKVSIDPGKHNLNGDISSNVKQNEQQKTKATDQEVQKENCSANKTKTIHPLNSDEKTTSCAKQEEQNQIKLTDQHVGAEHSDFNQHIQAQNSEDCNLNEGTFPDVKQNKKKKIKTVTQHVQPQNDGNLQDEQKKTNATTECFQPRDSDDVNLNEKHCFKQGEQKKMKTTDQHVQKEHADDSSLTENISPQIKQGKSKATDHQPICSEHSDLTENISPYINQKKTRIDKSDDCNLNKKISVHVKQDIKVTNPHHHVENSDDDTNLNEFLQVTKDEEAEKNTRGFNKVEFEISIKSNVNNRKKLRKLSRRKRLVSNPLREKLNNNDVYECNPSNEVLLAEHSYANSMLEALNDTQYLDMVLENIDKGINDPSLIYESNKKSSNENREDKYKDYHKKLMRVLNQSANSTSDVNLNNSNQTVAANSEQVISTNVNPQGANNKVNNKKNYCMNKLKAPENEGNINKAFIKSNNLNTETLKNCDLLHENLLIGNFHRKNGHKRIGADGDHSTLKDFEEKTWPPEVPGPTFKEMSLPKIISQMVEQLKRKGIWDISCSDRNSDGSENSTNPNRAKQGKKLEHPTSNKPKVVVEDKKNEAAPINRKSNTRKKARKTSDSTLKEESSLLTTTDLKEINDGVPSNVCITTTSNSEDNNLRNEEQYMDVTEEASDRAANDDGDDLNEKVQCTRPYVLDAWLISINGMKEIYKNLQRRRFQNISTREFNADCVKYMLHMVKQTNGIDQPCPVEKEDYQVLDKDLVEHAFLPEASITVK